MKDFFMSMLMWCNFSGGSATPSCEAADKIQTDQLTSETKGDWLIAILWNFATSLLFWLCVNWHWLKETVCAGLPTAAQTLTHRGFVGGKSRCCVCSSPFAHKSATESQKIPDGQLGQRELHTQWTICFHEAKKGHLKLHKQRFWWLEWL